MPALPNVQYSRLAGYENIKTETPFIPESHEKSLFSPPEVKNRFFIHDAKISNFGFSTRRTAFFSKFLLLMRSRLLAHTTTVWLPQLPLLPCCSVLLHNTITDIDRETLSAARGCEQNFQDFRGTKSENVTSYQVGSYSDCA